MTVTIPVWLVFVIGIITGSAATMLAMFVIAVRGDSNGPE